MKAKKVATMTHFIYSLHLYHRFKRVQRDKLEIPLHLSCIHICISAFLPHFLPNIHL